MTISAVGPAQAASTFGPNASVNMTALAIGDVLVVWAGAGNPTAYQRGSLISGSMCAVWNEAVYNTGSNPTCDIWWGVITNLGSTLVNCYANYSGGYGGSPYLTVQQFNSTISEIWAQDSTGANYSLTGSSGTSPPLTASEAECLYVTDAMGGTWSPGAGYYAPSVYINPCFFYPNASTPNVYSVPWSGSIPSATSAAIIHPVLPRNPIVMLIG